MEKVPDRVLVILDEAYFEYAMYTDDYPDSMHYRYDNVITLRTFSKIYGLAGFRVGYGFAHKTLISNLLKVKLPFEPSVPAQAAAIASLEDSEYLEKSLAVNIEGMELLSNTFISHQLRFTPSVTNFLTLVFEDVKLSNHISMELLKRGVIVRNLISFGLPECIRVTIGTQDENLFFIQQLEEIVKLI
jgi:histidinol-phosphate aminotransferase